MNTAPASPIDRPTWATTLVCHPATPCGPALTLSVRLALAGAVVGPQAQAGLLLSYQLSGDVAALQLPAPATPGPADGLWQHTCFELFTAVPGEAAYQEFNFSPSGQWAAYRFGAERVRDPVAERLHPAPAPWIDLYQTADTLTLQAWLPLSAWPAHAAQQTLQLGLSAVLEDRHGQLSYWALQHPSAQPDFHHRSGLSLALTLPGDRPTDPQNAP